MPENINDLHEILEVIAKRLSSQGPIVAQINEVAAAQSRGNELIAALAAMPELLVQIRVLLTEIRDLLKTPNAVNIGLAGGKIEPKKPGDATPPVATP